MIYGGNIAILDKFMHLVKVNGDFEHMNVSEVESNVKSSVYHNELRDILRDHYPNKRSYSSKQLISKDKPRNDPTYNNLKFPNGDITRMEKPLTQTLRRLKSRRVLSSSYRT